jgi:pyridoxal phosphate enzyme (YggS family)
MLQRFQVARIFAAAMIDEINKTLARQHVKLVAVSKTHAPERILEIYRQGQRAFGENRVQEMLSKHTALPDDIEWHMIGHLQTNKVKMIAPFVQMIHAVDSLDLLQEIDKQALKAGRVIDCLLQFHIAAEDSKFGFEEPEARKMLQDPAYQALKNVRICGVMGMATFTEDKAQVRQEFRSLKGLFARLKADFFADEPWFKEISMGMSDDWSIAVEEGSTIVRIGSLIFGSR